MSNKDKRRSGWYTPEATCSPKELKEQNIEINEEYDDWRDKRDGMRDTFRDFKQIKNVSSSRKKRIYGSIYDKRINANKKQEKLLKIRKARGK